MKDKTLRIKISKEEVKAMEEINNMEYEIDNIISRLGKKKKRFVKRLMKKYGLYSDELPDKYSSFTIDEKTNEIVVM